MHKVALLTAAGIKKLEDDFIGMEVVMDCQSNSFVHEDEAMYLIEDVDYHFMEYPLSFLGSPRPKRRK